MVQRGQELRLAMEARDAVGFVREALRDDLQGDIASELRIARAIDLAHSAGAKRSRNLVETKPGTGGERHVRQGFAARL